MKAVSLEAAPYHIAINTMGPGASVKPTDITWEEYDKLPQIVKYQWADPAELGKGFVWLLHQPPALFSGFRFDAGPIALTVKREGYDFEFAPEKVTLYPDDFKFRENWYTIILILTRTETFLKKRMIRDMEYIGSVGPKEVVCGKQAVCSSSHPIVTETMVSVMRDGGNAADAAIAGSLVQAVVEPHMTNHAGSAAILYWEARTGKAYHLNGHGTLVPDMAPFRPVPPIGIRFAMPDANPCAAIPGFMPALGEMHRRFGSQSWADLCQPALEWARSGHPVSSFEYGVLQEELRFYTYFPSGRELFTPDGFLPEVGQTFQNTRPGRDHAPVGR